jgi:hypothetical protein
MQQGFFSLSSRTSTHNAIATSSCGANVCKWALCTTILFQLYYCIKCIRHVDAPGQ